MKIAVLVKQVPGGDSPLRISDDQLWVIEDNVNFITNESDAYAVEEALQLREKSGEGEVVAVSFGPERTQRTIREALSKGADRGIHIEDSYPYSSDPLKIATALSEALKEEQFDLILSGLQSDDYGFGQVGVLLGETLGMTTATLVMSTELSDGSLKVKRELESGWFQWVSLSLPASISIQSGINTPRYPSLKGIMGAKKKEIKSVAPDSATAAAQAISRVYIPQKTKKTEMIEGTADQQVKRLAEVLKKEIRVV
tara:strand:+ start:3893 stop:4657 length:765 start_codon:yes stop_codon:yes gene_type:complete